MSIPGVIFMFRPPVHNLGQNCLLPDRPNFDLNIKFDQISCHIVVYVKQVWSALNLYVKFVSAKGPQDVISRELMISGLNRDYVTQAKTLKRNVLMIAFPEPGVEPVRVFSST